MVGPWILFAPRKKGGKLSDIEYLSIKDFDGKRVDVDAVTDVNLTTTETDLATQTASSGKDMYLAGARVTGTIDVAGGAGSSTILRLRVNGVDVEQKRFEELADESEFSYTFLTKGVKVAATEIIKITAQHSNTTQQSKLKSKLLLFEETTGESPQVPTI